VLTLQPTIYLGTWLISIRKKNKVFTQGSFTTVLAVKSKSAYGFRRECKGEVAQGYINNGDTARTIKAKVAGNALN
jgi:hypothetical protein